MIKPLPCLILLISASGLWAQTKNKSVTVKYDVAYATVDRPGELYVVAGNGQIQKFSVDGNLLNTSTELPAPTLFDPRDGSRLFAYYRQDQHYAYLSPSFEVTASHQIDPALVIDPWLACASGDHNIWALDGADKTLKRINSSTSGIDVEVGLPNITDLHAITFMREYQGFLFLLHRDRGIIVFSSMGKELKTIGYPAMKYFNFLGEELYYQEGDVIKLLNLFTGEKREINIPGRREFKLITDERSFTIHGNTIEFLPAAH